MIEKIIEKLKGKKIAILGFGREGKSTYHFLKKYLDNIDITICDENKIDLDDSVKKVEGKDYLKNLEEYDIIIKSPGISLKDVPLEKIQNKITSQLELLLEVNKKNIIGITGTKGKSTTSTLTYEVLKDQLNDVYLLGNIGVPVLDEIENYKENTTLVIEMSSHQLEFVKQSPHIACILNLYEDHLDHAGSITHYYENKMNIFRYQTEKDYCIYSEDNETLKEMVEKTPLKSISYKVRFDEKKTSSNTTRKEENKVLIEDEVVYEDGTRKILGDHNLKNIMFVLTIVKILGLDFTKAKKVIENFKGLKYRMEYIGNAHGIDYYNDTIATIPNATESAIESLQNIETVIIGGLDRGIHYEEFIEFLRNSKLKTIICMPTTGIKIGKALENSDKCILYAETLEEAYHLSKKHTRIGAGCILSPAAASYEFFKNFEEKGRAFEEIVRKEM